MDPMRGTHLITAGPSIQVRRTISGLRWWIATVLFSSTIINYLDRQSLSLLAPFLKLEYHWSNTDYAYLAIAFRVAYAIGQTLCGRLIDRIGTRQGLTFAVAWYSLVSLLTPFARGLFSLGCFRFLLGAGESANWPAATKAVSEWFPKQERGLATAFFDSGSSIGGAIAPFIVLPIYSHWGWRPAVAIPGLLGFFWIVLWRKIYYPPQSHPLISAQERGLLSEDRRSSGGENVSSLKWCDLLKLRQTWGTISARLLTDPVWFFITDWFPIYLVAKGVDLKNVFLAVWAPFIAADLGNLFGGLASGWLIRHGWRLGTARKAVVVFGGVGVTVLIPTIFTSNVYAITFLFAFATFSYAAFSTIANVLPADLYGAGSVASVSGLSGTASGIGTVIAFQLVGYYSDLRHTMATHSFDPIIVIAGLIPFCGMILVLLLVRNTKATEQGLVRPI